MSRSFSRSSFWTGLLAVFICGPILTAVGQVAAPNYEECRLDSIFPNGGQQGTTVEVEFLGHGLGLSDPKDIIVDGPAGVRASNVRAVNGGLARATLTISKDALPGRRWLRVLNERSGLTNFAHFLVGTLPEVLEHDQADLQARPQPVTLPIVATGRIHPAADIDAFQFSGLVGQKIVAAITAHAIDVHGQYKDAGIADFSLELLDSAGRTLASAEDTVGFDPLIETTLPADGSYIIRVQLLNYAGFPQAVYRLTLGDVPYPTVAFPAGMGGNSKTPYMLFGPNVPSGTSVVTASWTTDPAYRLRHIGLPDLTSGTDVPILEGDEPESVEQEPNSTRATAESLPVPGTVHGRLLDPGDVDWYRLELGAMQRIRLETIAHRFVRSPLDTALQLYDSSGALIAENDDEGREPGYESYHDFKTTDSRLDVTAPARGTYFLRVSDQNGTSGVRATYRLTSTLAPSSYCVSHFPDAVPIWGPGSTACLLARIDRDDDFQEDVEVRVVDLPEGWKSSAAISLGRTPQRFYNNYQNKVFLTITAPSDAPVGTCVPFRVVAQSRPRHPATQPSITAHSRPLTLFYTSDTGFFRMSPQSRVAIARPQGPWLESATGSRTLAPGDETTLDIRVQNAAALTSLPVVVSLATNGIACGLTTPQSLPIKAGMISVPVKLPADMPVGDFGVTVAQSWRNDIRVGMPGPCTPLIRLNVVAPVKAGASQ